ncbi:MAG: LpxI family protein [Thermodesulfobacteriota bacterium]
MNSRKPLGILAGEGQFPILVARGAKSQGREVVAVAFKGYTSQEISLCTDKMLWLYLGQLGKMISFLQKNQVQEIVLAGGINKPRALSLRPDLQAAKLLLQTRSRNDNALFEALIHTLNKQGLRVASPLDFVPDLRTPAGCLSKRRPSQQEEVDIDFGWELAKEIGSLDIGQCLVVKEKMVVAVEAMEGTNAAILRAGELAGTGCVVLKVFKPGQEERIDQPALGLQTIRTMLQAGASCLVAEAGKSLFFDQDQALQLADQNGICVLGKKDANP